MDHSIKGFYIIKTISILASLIVVIILVIFIVKKKTPIVMASDFKVSILHLSMQGLTFIITPIVFLTRMSCITKPLILTTLYTLNIGIVFTKSQKILQAFLSKVRITSEEVKRTMITQIFTVVNFLLLTNIVLYVSLHQEPAKILEIENHDQLTREQVCNTYFHSTMVMIALTVIQLMCAIQAFRGRNLPSVMNDGIMLMYATFILTASFAVCFIIVPFQKPIEKEISQCIAILINTVVITLLLYGQKAFRMVFHPEQNTRAYFQVQRLKGVEKKINQRIELK
eukprot:TCONS_00022879-protein